jgi:hypothetical protein
MKPARAWPGLVTLLLFAGSLALYLGIGLALAPGRLFERADLALGADVPRVIADLTRFDANHYRTKVHPLFVILLNPLGTVLKALLGAPRPAALLLNSAAGALGVALFHLLLLRLGVAAGRAVLWTALFALSSSQLFFGSVPETYAFSGASLLLLFLLFAHGAAGGWSFVAAAVVSFGMTVSNLAVAVWLRACAADLRRGLWSAVPRLVGYTAAVAGLTAALGMLQALWYPRARLFFGPAAFQEETQYAFLPGTPAAFGQRVADLAASSLLFNLAAPTLTLAKAGQRRPVTAFVRPGVGALRPVGVAHAALWAALLTAATTWGWRQRVHRQPAAGALLGALGFQLVLHFFYGESLFLYSCHFTFAVIALVALAAEQGLAVRPSLARGAALALVGLVALQAADNAAFLRELYAIYR